MSVLAEFRVPASEFVLADTLTTVPAVRVEIKRVVAGSEKVTPYFWAYGADLEAFEELLHADSDTEELLVLDARRENERFYRVTWRQQFPTILAAISDAKATILEAVNEAEGLWELKVLFPTRDGLGRFHEYCTEHEFTYELQRLYRPENPQERGEYGVTDDQQEALVAAYERRYFDVPRGTTLVQVADALDISQNAVSARLRRGLGNLISNTLVHEE